MFVTITLAAANIHHPAISWLRPLTRNEIIKPLAISVIALWGISRIALALQKRQDFGERAMLLVAISIFEILAGFIVFLFWAVGMIGGPINPG